jgi:hypothetical protein
MSDEEKEYKREWYQKNKERLKEKSNENREEILRKKREWYHKNKEKIKENSPDRSEYLKEYYRNNKEKFSDYYQENKDSILENRKDYYENNKGDKKDYNKKYREENIDSLKEYNKNYYQENKENLIDRQKEYYFENIDKHRKYQREYNSKRLKEDYLYKLYKNTGSLISKSFKANGYKKSSRTHEILGCSFEEFKLYLESKFEDWMTWDNKGLYNGELNYGWDIDHIIPISNSKTKEDVVLLNHFTNLQPLCSYTNRYIKKNLLEDSYCLYCGNKIRYVKYCNDNCRKKYKRNIE